MEDDDVLSELLGNIKESKTETKNLTSYMDEEKVAAKEYMKSLTIPKRIKANLQTEILKTNFTKKIKGLKNEKPLNEVQNIPENIVHEYDSNISVSDNDISFKSDKTYDTVKKGMNESTDTVNDSIADTSVDTVVENDNFFDDDFDVTDLEGLEKENASKSTEMKKEEIIEDEFITSNWDSMQESTNMNVDMNISINTEELPSFINSEEKQVRILNINKFK